MVIFINLCQATFMLYKARALVFILDGSLSLRYSAYILMGEYWVLIFRYNLTKGPRSQSFL